MKPITFCFKSKPGLRYAKHNARCFKKFLLSFLKKESAFLKLNYIGYNSQNGDCHAVITDTSKEQSKHYVQTVAIIYSNKTRKITAIFNRGPIPEQKDFTFLTDTEIMMCSTKEHLIVPFAQNIRHAIKQWILTPKQQGYMVRLTIRPEIGSLFQYKKNFFLTGMGSADACGVVDDIYDRIIHSLDRCDLVGFLKMYNSKERMIAKIFHCTITSVQHGPNGNTTVTSFLSEVANQLCQRIEKRIQERKTEYRKPNLFFGLLLKFKLLLKLPRLQFGK